MEEVQDKLPYYDTLPAYQYHLQQLVMEETQERRVAYTERFLPLQELPETPLYLGTRHGLNRR